MTPCWTEKHLGEVITLQRGFDLPERERQSGVVPIVSSSGITGYHVAAKCNPPGVVTGRYGTLGEVFYIDDAYWPLNTTLWVKDFKGNNPRFVSFLLKTLNLGHQNAAGAVPGVNRNALHLLPVKVPPLQTQRHIAEIISAYEDLIENNTRRIKILEQMAQMLYREWFINFRFPGREKVKMVESEIGVCPEGWCQPYHKLVDFLEGPGLRRWQYRDTGLRFLNIRTIGNGDIDLTKTQFIDPNEAEKKYKHFLLSEFDHVVSSSGTLGRIVTVRQDHLPLMLNTSVIRMRPRTSQVGRWQLKGFLRSDYFQNQILSFASGAAQMNFGPVHLKQMKILAPSAEISAAFEKIVSPQELSICNLIHKNLVLRKTRDLLLPKLVSGELSVEHFGKEAVEQMA
ncbi:restriction endonuclease subunit S [Occallatibacter savannae]|uniref:restriction endonuclease subunit S n=1 Tax=Occallatibacter savannae TaxID=1002691 RepID=UPI000D69226B|nr:restriction endonuclease subunit S [Occallatibacter savannae]